MTAECYIGFVNGEPIGFVAMAPFPHPSNKDILKVSRIVSLPHWQGTGVGMKMVNAICEFTKYEFKCIHLTTTLPLVHKHLYNSPKWIIKSQGGWDVPKTGAISTDARCNIYLETHKFINSSCVEADIKPHYGELKEFDQSKKTNDHKLDILLPKIEKNKITKAEIERLKELKKAEIEKDANYYDDLMNMFG